VRRSASRSGRSSSTISTFIDSSLCPAAERPFGDSYMALMRLLRWPARVAA
jgi:hypothetical protein